MLPQPGISQCDSLDSIDANDLIININVIPENKFRPPGIPFKFSGDRRAIHCEFAAAPASDQMIDDSRRLSKDLNSVVVITYISIAFGSWQ